MIENIPPSFAIRQPNGDYVTLSPALLSRQLEAAIQTSTWRTWLRNLLTLELTNALLTHTDIAPLLMGDSSLVNNRILPNSEEKRILVQQIYYQAYLLFITKQH